MKERMSAKCRAAEVYVPVTPEQTKCVLRVAPRCPKIDEMQYWPRTAADAAAAADAVRMC